MRTVTTADGGIFPVFRCGAADGVLWIGLTGMEAGEAAEIFGNPAKTARITERNAFGTETVYAGYTNLIMTRTKEAGPVVALRNQPKEDDNHGETL